MKCGSTVPGARRHGAVRRQRGMALLIALIVLVVVSILGIAAMRIALFQNRVSINSQLSNLAFQSAESGLGSASGYVVDQVAAGKPFSHVDNIFFKAVDGQPQLVCFSAAAVTAVDGSDKVTLDADGIPVPDSDALCDPTEDGNSRVTTVVFKTPGDKLLPRPGTDISIAGGLLPIAMRAYAEVPNTNVTTVHAQEWGVPVPAGVTTLRGVEL